LHLLLRNSYTGADMPRELSELLKSAQETTDSLYKRYLLEKEWLEKVVLGEEGTLRLHLRSAKSCLKHVKALLLPRFAEYGKPRLDFADFLKAIAEDVVAFELLRVDRDEELKQVFNPHVSPKEANHQPFGFEQILRVYQSALIGFAFKRGVRDEGRRKDIATKVLMLAQARFNPLLGSFTGYIFRFASKECIHGVGEPAVEDLNEEVGAVRHESRCLAGSMLAIHSDRLRIIASLGKPAHESICFLLKNDLEWSPKAILDKFSKVKLRDMFDHCVREYETEIGADVRVHLEELQRELLDASAGDKLFGDSFTEIRREPGQVISDWCVAVDRALAMKIDGEEEDYLRTIFEGDESPRELLIFCMIRLLRCPVNQDHRYMTMPLYDLLHKVFEPQYRELPRLKEANPEERASTPSVENLEKSRISEVKLKECTKSLSERVAVPKGGGVSGRLSGADPKQWHKCVRARIQNELTKPSDEGRCKGLLFAFVHGYL